MERVSALTAKIEKWDQQIDEINSMRESAVTEISNLLGAPSTFAGKFTAKSQPTEKLGDRILAVLRTGDGLNRDTIAARVKEASQKVSLSLYHLVNRGDVYEQDSNYWLRPEVSSATKSVVSTD